MAGNRQYCAVAWVAVAEREGPQITQIKTLNGGPSLPSDAHAALVYLCNLRNLWLLLKNEAAAQAENRNYTRRRPSADGL